MLQKRFQQMFFITEVQMTSIVAKNGNAKKIMPSGSQNIYFWSSFSLKGNDLPYIMKFDKGVNPIWGI